jgi:hypothetical protein
MSDLHRVDAANRSEGEEGSCREVGKIGNLRQRTPDLRGQGAALYVRDRKPKDSLDVFARDGLVSLVCARPIENDDMASADAAHLGRDLWGCDIIVQLMEHRERANDIEVTIGKRHLLGVAVVERHAGQPLRDLGRAVLNIEAGQRACRTTDRDERNQRATTASANVKNGLALVEADLPKHPKQCRLVSGRLQYDTAIERVLPVGLSAGVVGAIECLGFGGVHLEQVFPVQDADANECAVPTHFRFVITRGLGRPFRGDYVSEHPPILPQAPEEGRACA